MKIISKVLSVVLAMSMLFGTVTFATTYKDVAQDKNYYSAVSLLSALDIIKGYEDGTFGPEKNVTRAEFAVMLIRTLGLSGVGNSDPAGLTFKDLGTVAWAVSDIRTAFDLGIINGMSAEEFAPDSQVTYEQAIKMIVCALGYEPVALDRVGGDKALIYPDGYLAVATQNNVDGGVAVKKGQPAKRWEIARLIFNSLEIDLMEKSLAIGSDKYEIRKGKTILSDKLRIRTSTGELKADEKTSISTTGQTSKIGEVLITEQGTTDEEIFLKGTIATDGIVGHSIKYYFREDNNGLKTLAYLESKTKDSSILKINASNIDDVTVEENGSVTIAYWGNKETDRNTEKITLVANSSIVINGRTATEVDPEVDFMPLSGEIELMSSSSNGTYDKIFVTSYETYVVKTKLEKTIVDQYRNTEQDNTIEIDEDSNDYSLTVVKTDKTAMTFSSITTWNVLSIKKTKDTREVIVANSAPINGGITELDKDNGKIKIGNTDKLYEFSNYFKKYNAKGITEMNVDDSGKFYLDKDGRIAAFDKSASRGNNYGYLDKAVIENNDEYKFRILLQTASTMGSVVTGANKIKLNGTVPANDSEITALEPQLVKYSLNASNQIDGIVTKTTEVTTDDTKLIPSINKDIYKYDTTTKQFIQVKPQGADATFIPEKFTVNTDTFVFVVPEVSDVASKYTKKNYSYFKDNIIYKLEAYNALGSMKTAKAVVVYGVDSSSVVSAETPIAIITKIVGATNADGAPAQKVTAYFYGKYDAGVTKEVWTESATTLADYASGDIIRFGTTEEGYIKDGSIESVLKVRDGVQGTFVELKDSSNNPIYKTVGGLLYAAGGTGAAQTFDIAKTKDLLECETAVKNTFSTNSSTAYFVYDSTLSSDTKFSKNSATDPLELSTKNYYNAEGIAEAKAAQIFVYALYDSVKVVYYIQ